MKAPFTDQYYEDPSIAQVCALEYERLWGRITRRVTAGGWFYREREIILAEEIPDISKAYGPVVGQRVQKAIQQTPPKGVYETRIAQEHRKWLIENRGGVSWIQRLSLKWLGSRLW